jgi:FG-GAP repeat
MLKHATALAAALALAAPATANAGFKEPVKVIWQHTGSAGNYFGWAVSPLADVNHDGAADAIIGEPGFASFDRGTTWLYSGATGAVLRRFDGQPGDTNGYAIADAGDTNRDGFHDIISGAPRLNADTEGHAYLYSGRDGSLLHTFTGEASGDSFGSAVSSAGDVNRDGRSDLLIGAATHAGGGMAFVYSGRSSKLLYRIPAPATDTTNAFGSGTGTTDDVNRDRIPDEIAGGGGAGYVFSGADGHELYSLPPSAAKRQFGTFFLAGVGDVNRDSVPDIYGGDYAAGDNGLASGFAGVYSGRDGTLLHSWFGAEPGAGLGPGRGAGDVDGDHRPDLAIGSYTSSEGAPAAGKIELYSGATGAKLRTITSTTAGENLGFDAVGAGDVDRDHSPDLLASAAEGDTVYMIAGTRRGHHGGPH